ncbi:PIG-L deacetylase family protein [Desulfonatronum thiosulfatophilum]|uniref:PIG-L deacetylase family protein n=1 Tax=Desulfonatronum thiosulfatophilum TaxID=617002 RepID=UPI00137980B8|nr:PIG-L deacetylase family protein [Desulfonatronum thiosulfatophilum]
MFELDRKTQAVFHATNILKRYIKPIQVRPPFGKRCLVVAPHSDDEAIGCGGSVLSHLSKNGDARIIIVQDGSGAEAAIGLSRKELIEIREQESIECAKRLGIEAPRFLRYARVGVDNVSRLAADLEGIIMEYQPDAVFGPFILDHNYEHENVSLALALALERTGLDVEVYSYEVWGLCIPNVAVFIDEFIDAKCELIACFKSQTRCNDYAHAFKGLAMYNSLQFGAIDTKYVERFLALPGNEYVDFVKKVAG